MLTPFDPQHLSKMRLLPSELPVLELVESRKILVELGKIGLCDTILTDDGKKVLGVVAAVPLQNRGECEVFIVQSSDQKKHPVVFAKNVRGSLETIRRRFDRIQAVGEDSPFYTRWFTWLGFRYEGPAGRREEFGDKKMMMWEMPGVMA